MMFIDVLWIMMFHESLCITLLLFHFVQFLNFSSSISPNPLAAWHGVFKSQVLASDYRSRAGLHALRAKDDTVLLIANVHLQGWGQGWEVEVGSWRHIWQKGVPKVISCSTFLDVASIVTVIWIMNIHESCVWPFQKMKGVFFFFGGGFRGRNDSMKVENDENWLSGAGIHWPQRHAAPSCVQHFVILTGCKRSFKSVQMKLPQL